MLFSATIPNIVLQFASNAKRKHSFGKNSNSNFSVMLLDSDNVLH